ncbi:MAG TPA: hypothetical protein VN578_07815 [Candidatus Binatia bacterium]|nr:hypothetical protein [Candidatus Binatia bacterium]
MKLIRSTKETLVFQLGPREKHVLLEVLKLYPKIPPAHQPLSKSARLPEQEASQRLLDDALAEQRVENKAQVQRLLSDPRRFATHEKGWRLSLSRPEVEWLLQVLNDIRVGSWLMLGSPEGRIEVLTEQTAPHVWAMEMAGAFEIAMLQALEGGSEK